MFADVTADTDVRQPDNASGRRTQVPDLYVVRRALLLHSRDVGQRREGSPQARRDLTVAVAPESVYILWLPVPQVHDRSHGDTAVPSQPAQAAEEVRLSSYIHLVSRINMKQIQTIHNNLLSVHRSPRIYSGENNEQC